MVNQKIPKKFDDEIKKYQREILSLKEEIKSLKKKLESKNLENSLPPANVMLKNSMDRMGKMVIVCVIILAIYIISII